MDPERERVLTLAHESELQRGPDDGQAVIKRARLYLDFLKGTRDAEIISAACALTERVRETTS
jgi:hypothetical protein